MRNFLGRVVIYAVLSLAWGVLAVYAWGYDHTGLTHPRGDRRGRPAPALGRPALADAPGPSRLQVPPDDPPALRLDGDLPPRDRPARAAPRPGRLQPPADPEGPDAQRRLRDHRLVDQKAMPNYVLLGVADPKGVMDLVWHHARAEQDQRNVRVEQI